MRYLIAHTFSGDVADFHKEISGDIAKEFNKKDVARRIDPHLTLKSPFTGDEAEIAELARKLSSFADNHDPVSLQLDGFESFGSRVVYLDVNTEKAGRIFLNGLSNTLSEVSWFEMGKHDTDITLHATVARPDTKHEYKAMMKFLHDRYDPDFETQLDTLDILVLKDDKWKTHESFPLE